MSVTDQTAFAWQRALAAEFAAAFAYGSLGPHVTAAAQIELARACEEAHRDAATSAAASLSAAGRTPVDPEPSYSLPFAITDEATARQLALHVETAAAQAWRYLISVEEAPADVRVSALAALTATAERAVRWRELIDPDAPSTPFPGI